ncbi:AAA family ATPase [Nostoc sp. CHAB 5836]|uniref:NB-ARC domain-containing protein n=1 Tax=Nostoc sp. CHAB 5836 TaxID=2780404 RepID=UPI001E37FEC0|nr:NB-ARC domain-containing protein [Nostoc sp. CHAB 5836]MCC5618288.1 AAA family ATPase [Nostoc sp. CHAB 5836]
MNAKEAIQIIDDLVFGKQGRWLEEPEKIVLRSAWLDLDYKDVAENSLYDINLLQRRVAPKLWVLLTGILGNGEKVTKKRLRGIVEKQIVLPDKEPAKWNEAAGDLPILTGNLPEISNFYGRTPELAMLKELIAQERCVAIIGTAGIGKSALVAKLVQALRMGSYEFNGFIWKSISYSPLLTDLVADLLRILAYSEKQELDLPESIQARISKLFDYLRSRRYLVILDSAESLLQGDRNTSSNAYGKHYAEYGTFFNRVIEEQHQSCFLLTSREPFIDFNRLQKKGQPVRTLKLEGLGKEALEIFRFHGLTDEDKWGDLIQTYRGNPLSLNILADKIQKICGGSVEKFLNFQTVLMTDIFQDSLDELFEDKGRLTILEKQIMFHLAEQLTKESGNSIELTGLLKQFKERQQNEVTTSEVLEAIEALYTRSLIEQEINDSKEVLLSLEPQVIKYVCSYALKLVQNTVYDFKSA